jgi:hypothetical protein
MGVYVAEINGRGLAAVNADKASDAEAFLDSSAVEAELMILESNGVPLWDGETEICVREALPDEQATWRQSRDEAVREGKIGASERETWLSFLVPVIDPTDPAEIVSHWVFHC